MRARRSLAPPLHQYNYLLDPSIRRQMKLSLENTVVILDEAHNVEGVCADASSFELDAATVTNAVRELDRCLSYAEHTGGGGGGGGANGNRPPVSSDELLELKGRFLKFERAIMERLEHPKANGERQKSAMGGVSYPGHEVYKIFGADGLGVTPDNCRAQIELLDRTCAMLTEEADAAGRQSATTALHDVLNTLHIVFRDALRDVAVDALSGVPARASDSSIYYRVHIAKAPAMRDASSRRSGGKDGGPTLHYWFVVHVRCAELNVVLTVVPVQVLSSGPCHGRGRDARRAQCDCDERHVVAALVVCRRAGDVVSGAARESTCDRSRAAVCGRAAKCARRPHVAAVDVYKSQHRGVSARARPNAGQFFARRAARHAVLFLVVHGQARVRLALARGAPFRRRCRQLRRPLTDAAHVRSTAS